MPRLLKFRTGHHAPVNCIRYYGEDGKQILTAGRDRALRYTSVVRDSRSHELSQGKPRVVDDCLQFLTLHPLRFSGKESQQPLCLGDIAQVPACPRHVQFEHKK